MFFLLLWSGFLDFISSPSYHISGAVENRIDYYTCRWCTFVLDRLEQGLERNVTIADTLLNRM